jgi:hypothetical protein
MSINQIVNGFLRPNHTFEMKYDGKIFTGKLTDKDRATSKNYTVDFKPVKHEAFVKFQCGAEKGGYCHANKACNDKGVCGPFSSHFNAKGKNAKYRSCLSAVDKNCIENTICNTKQQCVPIFRV